MMRVDCKNISDQFTGKGGLFRNRRFTNMRNFESPDVVECIKPSLSIRNAVNKSIGQFNTQQWNVEITAFDSRDLRFLQVNLVSLCKKVNKIKM